MSSPLASPLPWNLVANDYEKEVVPMFEAFAARALELAAPASGRIVDVACGPGTLAALAARRGLAVDALDFSPAMIERLETRKLPGVTARIGDGQALPYADGAFAAGFSMFGLMFFPDRAKGFAELRRVLAPGARAVVSSWYAMESVPAFAVMFGALRPGFAELMAGRPPQPQAPSPLTTEDECRSEMSAAFSRVEVHTVSQRQQAPSVDALWESLVRTMAPVVLLRKGLGEARWAPYDAAARAAIRQVAGDGPIELEMRAFLTVGVAA